MIQITANFTLEELTDSATARKEDYKEQFNPTSGVIRNLEKLAINILQPLRDSFNKPIIVNCAYRCPRLNQKVGGVATSQHVEGKAADITSDDNKALFELAKSLPFDQMIAEGGNDANGNHKFSWIHISYDETRNRKQILYL